MHIAEALISTLQTTPTWLNAQKSGIRSRTTPSASQRSTKASRSLSSPQNEEQHAEFFANRTGKFQQAELQTEVNNLAALAIGGRQPELPDFVRILVHITGDEFSVLLRARGRCE